MCILHTHQISESAIEAWFENEKSTRLFEQGYQMKSYIMMNTSLGTPVKNEFLENIFMLIINSIFGKIMEDIRNYKKNEFLIDY